MSSDGTGQIEISGNSCQQIIDSYDNLIKNDLADEETFWQKAWDFNHNLNSLNKESQEKLGILAIVKKMNDDITRISGLRGERKNHGLNANRDGVTNTTQTIISNYKVFIDKVGELKNMVSTSERKLSLPRDVYPVSSFLKLYYQIIFDNGSLDSNIIFMNKCHKKKQYLFSWDEIPGNHTGRLMEFLKKDFGLDWVKTSKIEKIDDVMTIYTEKNFLSLRLNNGKTIVNLKIDDGRTDELFVDIENGKLNICKNHNESLEESINLQRRKLSDISSGIKYLKIITRDFPKEIKIKVSDIETNVNNFLDMYELDNDLKNKVNEIGQVHGRLKDDIMNLYEEIIKNELSGGV